MDNGYKFSWRRLPAGLRTCVAELVGVRPSATDAVWEAKLGEEPDLAWLAENWLTLREYWLFDDLPNARTLARGLLDLGMGRPERYGRSRDEVYQYLCSCRASPTLAEVLYELLWELGGYRPRRRQLDASERSSTDVSTVADELTPYQGLRRWAPPEDGTANPFVPHIHQEEAWAALDRSMTPEAVAARGRGLRGLLVLPTGGGKTVTATRWIARNFLQKDSARPVLWIAHRAELLEQASDAFGRSVDITDRDRNDPLDVQCLSSMHGRGADRLIDAQIEVTCASIRTLTAGDNVHVVERFLDEHTDAFVVIDEAHHAGARTYRQVLEIANRHKKVDVLGLTATPTRTAESERGWLAKLFPDGIIYEADLTTLIARGVLARPIMNEVDTGEAIVLSPKERSHLQKFSDYSPETLLRLAESVSRNTAIVEHYLSRRDDYGQTLVFATSVLHAYTLAERFRDADVKADYVTHSIEPGREPNEVVLERFRNGELQVLTSVTKLTEGVDLPSTQTVFLARPTRSEILLKQMVGRALRGPATKGGTETAHLVSFADHWEEFADWLDPRSLFPATEIVPEPKAEPPNTTLVEVPWALYQELARQVRQTEFQGAVELVPAGWFDLTGFEGEVNQRPLLQVLVYDHQLDGFAELLAAAAAGGVDDEEIDGFFAGVPQPVPTAAVLRAVAEFVDEMGHAPPFVEFRGRDQYLPRMVAERYLARPEGTDIAFAGLVWDTTDAQVVFPDRSTYVRAVRRCVEDIELDGPGPQDWVPVDLTSALRQPLQPGDWDLTALRDEVHAEMQLQKPAPPIRWSTGRLQHYWGYYTDSPPRITINALLQTGSISRESLKLLIYHELLHHELGLTIGHRGDFRARERQYPNFLHLNSEMNGLDDWFELGKEQR